MIRLGAYDLVDPAGQGGSGIVWQAFHRSSGRRVAIKVLSADIMADDLFRRAFRQRVRAAARLDHPHVMRVYDHGRISAEAADLDERLTEGALFHVMEWVGGGPLDVAAVPDWAATVDLAMALLSALAHAHSRGVVHRDLKPGNVIMAGFGELRPGPRLADFGGNLRRLAHPGGAPDAGAPDFLPPERLRQAWWEEGPSSDLYALGCMLWQVLTGELPHGGDSAQDIVDARLRGRFRPFKTRFPVPDGVRDWLRGLCSAALRGRPRSAADAMRGLIAVAGDALEGDAPEVRGARPRTRLEQLLLDAARQDDSPAFPALPGTGAVGDVADVADRPMGRLDLRPVPLVGRDQERARLWETLAEVQRSRTPRVVVLHGPTGFGKTALADWLAEQADQLGLAEPLRGRHVEEPGPQHGLGAMLARWLRVQGLDRDEAVPAIESRLSLHGADTTDAALVLAEMVADEQASAHSVAAMRFSHPLERHVRIRRLLETLSQQRPVVLVLDDLQWGSESRAFLRALLAEPSDRPLAVMVVATWSTDRAGDHAGVADEMRGILGLPGVQAVAVDALPMEHLQQLVRQRLGLHPELAVRVEERAGGSPSYVLQLVETWAWRGLIVATASGWRLADGAQVSLPRASEEVWLGRIEPLLAGWPSTAVVALELAAVLGQHVDGQEWRDVCRSLDLPEPTGLVDQLADAGLVVTELPGGFSFVHAMLRDCLVGRARQGGRLQRHHQACARMLTTGDRHHAAGRLGRHLVASGDPVASLLPLVAEAERAMDAGEYFRAEVLLLERDEALRAAPIPDDDPRWGRGWLAWCRLLQVHGRDDQVQQMADRTVTAGRQHHWDRHVAEALILLGRADVRAGRAAEAREHLAQALAQAQRLGDAALHSDVLRAQGSLLVQAGDLDGAAQRIQEALDLVQDGQHALRRAGCLLDLAYVARQRGDAERAARYAVDARGVYQEAGSRWGVANAHNLEGEVARMRGDLDQAIEHYQLASRRSTAVGGHLALVPRVNLGLALAEAGRAEEARQTLLDVLADGGAGQGPSLKGTVHAGLAASAALLRDWDATAHHVAMVGQLLGPSGYVDRDIPGSLNIAATAALDAGKVGLARAAVDLAAAQLRALGDAATAAEMLARLDGPGE